MEQVYSPRNVDSRVGLRPHGLGDGAGRAEPPAVPGPHDDEDGVGGAQVGDGVSRVQAEAGRRHPVGGDVRRGLVVLDLKWEQLLGQVLEILAERAKFPEAQILSMRLRERASGGGIYKILYRNLLH